MELDRPLLLAAEKPLRDNRVYIAAAKLLPHFVEFANRPMLLLVAGEAREERLAAGFQNVCLFPAEITASELINAVQAIFDRYDAWDEALRSCLESDGDLNELLNIGASRLKNPVMVCAADYSILARSNTIEDRGGLLGSHISYKLIQKLKMDTAFQKLVAQKRPYRFSEAASGTAFLCQNLFLGDDFAYRIIIADTQQPITPQSEILLEHIAGYVLRSLSDNRYAGALYVQESRFSRVEALL